MIKKIGNGNDLTVSIGGMIFTSQFEKEFSDIPFVLFSISAVHSLLSNMCLRKTNSTI